MRRGAAARRPQEINVTDRRDFGAALCRERERRGVSLDAVAEQTKINIALLAALERGDLSRWPTGIFRRAFVRAYASAVGLPAEDLVAAFERCFPERGEDGVLNVPSFERTDAPDSLRLTLASGPTPTGRVWGLRSLAALLDSFVVVAAGAGLAWFFAKPITFGTAIVGVIYFTAGTLLVESSPGAWALRRTLRRRPAAVPAPVVTAFGLEEVIAAMPRRTDSPARTSRRGRGQRAERPRVTRTVNRPQ